MQRRNPIVLESIVNGKLARRIVLVVAVLGLAAGGCGQPQDSRDNAQPKGSTATPRQGNQGGVVELPDEDYPTFDGGFVEYFYALDACLERAGFSAEVDPDEPSLEVSDPGPGQHGALTQAEEACEQEIGVPQVEPPNEPEIRAFYRALLESKRCLEDLGYEISDPPSEDAFVESYTTGPWHPYSDVPDVSEAEWERLNRECPQPGD